MASYSQIWAHSMIFESKYKEHFLDENAHGYTVYKLVAF